MKWSLGKRPNRKGIPCIDHLETLKHQNRAKALMELAALSDRLIAIRKKLHPALGGMPEFIQLQKLLIQVKPIESVLFEELRQLRRLRDEAISIAESLDLTEVAKALRGKDG